MTRPPSSQATAPHPSSVATVPVTPAPASGPAGSDDGRGGRRAVRLLAGARLVTTGGSQAAQVALAYEVYERTGSAAWVSAALLASAGAVGLVGPVSGRLGDRHDRRRVMVAAELAGAAGWALVLLARSPAMLVLAALVATAANAPFKAASSAAVPNLVPADRLAWANGLIATSANAAMVAGPLVGGALLGLWGPRAAFAVNAATFLVSAVAVARAPGTFSAGRPTGESPAGDASAGAPAAGLPAGRWRPVLADRLRRRLVAVTALTFAAFGVTLVADLPLVDHFGGGPVGYALLTTLWGTGAVVGSATASRLPAHRERTAVTAGTALMAVSIAALAVAPGLPVAIAVGTVGGLGSGVAFTPWFSLLQRAAPDHERSTSFALAETCEQAAFVGGMVLAGPLVAAVGPQPTYVVPALLLAAATWAARTLPRPTP